MKICIMEELFKVVGESVDIIRGSGADHIHFRESIILLQNNKFVTRTISTICRGDVLKLNDYDCLVEGNHRLDCCIVFAFRIL